VSLSDAEKEAMADAVVELLRSEDPRLLLAQRLAALPSLPESQREGEAAVLALATALLDS